jgi:mRNA-degrading endonuclease RelE of RelBE toxin-antitoxin system
MPNDRYDVEIMPKAKKDLAKLKQHEGAAVREILKLEGDPFLGHPLKGSLRQARSLEFNLPGRGECRAVYVIDEDNTVCIIFIVGPHKNIYARAQSQYDALLKQLK